MAEIWRKTLYDTARDTEIRGSTVLSDVQRMAFVRPVDYLANVGQVSQAPVVQAISVEQALPTVWPTNKYADIFANRQAAVGDDVVRKNSGSWAKILSPAAWGTKAGIAMIAISLFGLLYIGLPIAAAHLGSQLNQVSSNRIENLDKSAATSAAVPVSSPTYPVLKDQSQFSADDLYRYKDFRIIIPKINLESVIIKNVDPNNPSQYSEQLANGVAQAMGSYLPGENGTMLLFAHSTDTVFNIAKYNAKFYAVRYLEVGDEIMIRYGDKMYKYQIKDKKVISPDDLDMVRDSGYKLVLSTCYPPGTDWQRLVVFADPVVDK